MNDEPVSEGLGILESLRPVRRARIMDLVRDAGIDVSPWSWKAKGGRLSKPAANPHFCYEWAFGGNVEPTLLCTWHRKLVWRDGAVSCGGNARRQAENLERVAKDPSRSASYKTRASAQAKRARRFDLLLREAHEKSRPLRIVLLAGRQEREASPPGKSSSVVSYRLLDPEPWFVRIYDQDGEYNIVRGRSPSVGAEGQVGTSERRTFVDQFSNPRPPERRETTGTTYLRSGEIREAVLRRAGGVCEHCGERGFVTESGGTYLETHHVFPLSEDGPDVEWNVVAICPTDHRRAHFAADREKLRRRLVAQLIKMIPKAERELPKLLGRRPKRPGD